LTMTLLNDLTLATKSVSPTVVPDR
jgi:hypothetical protein